VLRRLSVFVGGFNLRAAEAVCATGDVESFDVADLLSSLVNKSLVAAERSSTSLRYRLLETIRQYAADQLIEVGGEADATKARHRHAEHYLQLCEEAALELIGPTQGIWLKRLDLEWDNLQAAFNTLASDSERTEDVLRLGVAVTRFFTTRQHRTPIAIVREALLSGVEVPTPLRAEALLALAMLIEPGHGASPHMMPTGEGPHETASDLCEEAVELARELGDSSLEAEALVWLSLISSDLELREPALTHALGALEIARRIGDPRLVGHALHAVGHVQPSPEGGREFYLEALAYFRQAGDLLWVCSTLLHLSIGLLTDLEQVRDARAVAEEAMELAEELGSMFHLRILWGNHGVFCYLLGEVEGAERYSRRSLVSARRLGLRLDESAWNFFVLACCATSNGDFARAAQLTGAHDAIDAGLPEPSRGIWSPLEIEMRDRNRARLVEALGEADFERASTVGRGLALDKVADLALGRFRPSL
jgi:tetratricopeptide (TPR) repeat protein